MGTKIKIENRATANRLGVSKISLKIDAKRTEQPPFTVSHNSIAIVESEAYYFGMLQFGCEAGIAEHKNVILSVFGCPFLLHLPHTDGAKKFWLHICNDVFVFHNKTAAEKTNNNKSNLHTYFCLIQSAQYSPTPPNKRAHLLAHKNLPFSPFPCARLFLADSTLSAPSSKVGMQKDEWAHRQRR